MLQQLSKALLPYSREPYPELPPELHPWEPDARWDCCWQVSNPVRTCIPTPITCWPLGRASGSERGRKECKHES